MKLQFRSLSIYIFLFLIFSVQNTGAETVAQTNRPAVANIDSLFIENALEIKNKDKVHQFYKKRNYSLAWMQGQKPRPQAKQLFLEVKNSDLHGVRFTQAGTDITILEQNVNQKAITDEAQLKLIDLQLTDLFFEYARHINLGVLQPEDVNYGYYILEKNEQSVKLLEEILKADNPKLFVKLEPVHPQYGKMKNQLEIYRNIKKGGGWPKITGVKLIEKGDSSAVVPTLINRLKATGEYGAGATNIYNAEVVAAVEKFQARHGLKVDGVVGPKTLEQLNVPVEERINQIIINMERLRWLPAKMGDPHVMVNIPEFMAYINEGDRQVMKMKVITGKAVNATVIFSDSISYLEMSPYWNIPYSIATQEILPKVKGNPGHLAANNYEVLYGNKVLNPYNVNWSKYNTSNFPYRLRQTPGLHNSLGTIKFIFPNRFNIYLHDTPSKHLFDQVERDFSHGCIRVEKPLEMAKYLLRDQPEWTESRIEEYRSKNSPERVYLKNKVPVYILYFTAFVDENGIMNFREDIYNHDKDLARKYFAGN